MNTVLLQTAIGNARGAIKQARERVAGDVRLTDAGKRLEVSRAAAQPLKQLIEQHRTLGAQHAALQGKLREAMRAADASAPRLTDTQWSELARAAREDEQLRNELSVLATTGANTPDEAAIVAAIAQAPHPRLFGLTPVDVKAARAAHEGWLREQPGVAELATALENGEFALKAAQRAMREFEADLDGAELKLLGVFPRAPQDMAEADSQAWMTRDPAGWALASANATTDFPWPAHDAPVAA